MKIDIVVYDSEQDDRVEQFIKLYNLKYEATYSRDEEYYDWIGIEIPEKLYTLLLLLENNWHIEKSKGAVGELCRTDDVVLDNTDHPKKI